MSSPKVYPRLCGGTCAREDRIVDAAGLSPPVRGNLKLREEKRYPRRSIPACAGEPKRFPGFEDKVRVYPRLCGGTLSGQ